MQGKGQVVVHCGVVKQNLCSAVDLFLLLMMMIKNDVHCYVGIYVMFCLQIHLQSAVASEGKGLTEGMNWLCTELSKQESN